MTQFSANLGFLWTELSLPNAIRAAHLAGFEAVECHWPYDTNSEFVNDVLHETGLRMLGLNTTRGNHLKGDNGLSALPDQKPQARAAIDQAVAYAVAVKCSKIHVMAGIASGNEAHETFIENLSYACDEAEKHDLEVLIEPLNEYDAPGYFLQSTDQALKIIQEIDQSNLKLMFDCYHVQLLEGDLTQKLKRLMPHIGHVQFAGVPSRGRPDIGEVDYGHIFRHLSSLGYTAPLGAEYKVAGSTEETLGWMKTLRT